MIYWVLYSFVVRAYGFFIRLLKPFNSKAKLWVDGRKNWKENIAQFDVKGQAVYWVHCASLGEFEQARPLIEALKKHNGNPKIILSFFSPSGYQFQKNYPLADYVCYLPIDTKSNASYFIKTIQPKAVFFIKYEFWFHYLKQLHELQIPTFLISGIFREKHYFFKFYGKWAAKQLLAFQYFFVQDQTSQNLLQTIGYTNSTIVGDTRFERVIQIMEQVVLYPKLEQFIVEAKVIVAGSTHLKDEIELEQAWLSIIKTEKNIKLIVVPHDVNSNRIKEIQNLFGASSCVLYSQIENNSVAQNILILDQVGMLSSLYKYADIAYIGGGFGKGIHNTLEAAVYGIPLLFGPNFQKFKEAKQLLEHGGAKVVLNANDIESTCVNWLQNPDQKELAGNANKKYVLQNEGAVKKIMSYLLANRLL